MSYLTSVVPRANTGAYGGFPAPRGVAHGPGGEGRVTASARPRTAPTWQDRGMTVDSGNETPAPKAPAKDPWELPDVSGLVVGVLGGTGPQGRGLAYRLAKAGQQVIIGSRAADRARATADRLGLGVQGADNKETARRSDVVIVAVPWEGHGETLEALREELAGKLVVDCVNPLGFDKQGAYALKPEEGSAAQQAAALLPESRVTAAFHHLSAVTLEDPEVESIDTDVLVLGDSRADTDLVQALAARIPGIRGVFAGRLRGAHQVEALVANLISVNRRYKAHAGLRLTDV
ncbi:reduced coenzyme F420:NADP oxidoreductase [Actinacidiphila glaucinigra]|uniref:Reduced coenzyme F420:NADP oxidoreductase n=2 Tax=Actinacidiphila glaucinigra TaxID=235986 RepID=A0A238ZJG5_9ACTN|nr:reduced coenzyme F420:NADP oxidoreductase [Actinacidiphila glaucinigra]